MKQLLLFLICNLAFLLTVQGNSAEIPPAVMFKQLSTTEGLSNNSVRSIYRDNRGFLWVGTESGLNKYDGYSFQQYYQNNSDLPDDAISEIFEGPDDNVWIRTSSGYSIYNYKTGKFDNDYKPILDGLQIPSKNILRMGKTSKNEFWAYDYSKLYIRSMDNSSIKAYPLAVEKISNLYIGVQFIYIMYSNGTLYSISKQTSEVKEIAIPTIYSKRLLNYILCIRFFIEVHSIVSASRFFHMPTYLRVVIECQSRFFPFFPAFSRNCPDYFLHTSGSSSFRSLSDLGAR